MHETRRADRPASAPRLWPRRAIFGLWVIAFVVAGVELASRWDSLVSRLAGPRTALPVAGGPNR